jgi:hypothetical protein
LIVGAGVTGLGTGPGTARRQVTAAEPIILPAMTLYVAIPALLEAGLRSKLAPLPASTHRQTLIAQTSQAAGSAKAGGRRGAGLDRLCSYTEVSAWEPVSRSITRSQIERIPPPA